MASALLVILPYCWFNVCSSFFFRRYSNPYASHVLSEDTLHREVKENKLFTRRLLCKRATSSLPNWTRFLVDKSQVLILKETIVDLCATRLVSFTRNLEHKKLVLANERTEYVVSEEDPTKTVMTRRTTINSPLGGLRARMIEGICHVRAIRNARRAVKGFLYVLAKENGESTGGGRGGRIPSKPSANRFHNLALNNLRDPATASLPFRLFFMEN